MSRRRGTVPLGLAILCLLLERDRHPYDLVATLKVRHKHESIRLNYGSLYSVVERLEADGLIRAVRTEQDGNRPPRTVYGITEDGRQQLVEQLSSLLSTPQREYLAFTAALALMPALPPASVATLLRSRLAQLEAEIAKSAADHDAATREMDLPRVLLIEAHFDQAMRVAERDFVAALCEEIDEGRLEGLAWWELLHRRGFPIGDDFHSPLFGGWRDIEALPAAAAADPSP